MALMTRTKPLPPDQLTTAIAQLEQSIDRRREELSVARAAVKTADADRRALWVRQDAGGESVDRQLAAIGTAFVENQKLAANLEEHIAELASRKDELSRPLHEAQLAALETDLVALGVERAALVPAITDSMVALLEGYLAMEDVTRRAGVASRQRGRLRDRLGLADVALAGGCPVNRQAILGNKRPSILVLQGTANRAAMRQALETLKAWRG